MTRRQRGAFRVPGPIVAQHLAEQRLPDAAPPVRGIDIHIGAPCRPGSVHAAHPAHDLLPVERHILANGALCGATIWETTARRSG